MKSIERLPIKYFEAEPTGKMASRITSDVDGMIILYRQATNVLMNAILSFILAYVGMFYLDPKLALLSFIVYPLAYIWIRFFLARLKRIAEKVNELRSLLVGKINEIINGINILQIFNFKKQTISEFNDLNKKYVSEQMNEVKLHITTGWNMIGIVRGIITTIVVVYFGYQHFTISEIVISAGLIYAYNEYLLKIIDPVNLIFTQVGEFQHALVRTERIHKIIEGPVEDNTFELLPRYRGDITFDNVWFAYEKDDYVLKGISFQIKSGEIVGLVGHTGSGKSSLMNALMSNDLSITSVHAHTTRRSIRAIENNDEYQIVYIDTPGIHTVSYTHLRAHETVLDLVCRLLLEKKKKTRTYHTSDKNT